MSEAAIHPTHWSPQTAGGEPEAKPALSYHGGNSMKIKQGVIALIAAGGTAGLLFGGTAVSTAFTSEQNGAATVAADHVGLGLTNGTFSVSGLLPGQTVTDSKPVMVDPSSSNAATALYLLGGTWTINQAGTGGNPNPADLTVNISIPSLGFSKSYNESALAGHTRLLYSGIPKNTGPLSATVSFTLAQAAGNDWNGAQVTIPYTLHLQDIAGTDANGYVATSNS